MSETQIKICGFTESETIIRAEKLGADYLGVVIDFPQVPQSISAEEAINLITILLEKSPNVVRKLVGVFVDKPIEELLHLTKESGLSIVQLHGTENPDYCVQVRSQGVEVLKAFRVQDATGVQELVAQINPYVSSVDGILLDAHSPRREGGAFGEKFDWNLAKVIKEIFSDIPLTLAGGLTSTNIQEAIALVDPQKVDVSSGVDQRPGVKDLGRIESFINATRRIYE